MNVPLFSKGFMPVRLPSSCLTMAPRLDKLEDASSTRPPFLELQPGDLCRGSSGSPAKDDRAAFAKREGTCSVSFFSYNDIIIYMYTNLLITLFYLCVSCLYVHFSRI